MIQQHCTNAIGVAADLVLWLLTVFAGILVWASITGLEAANQTIAMRRERRRRVGALREFGGEVWARHAGRQPLARVVPDAAAAAAGRPVAIMRAALLLALVCGLAVPAAVAAERPVVVELFTSQGCSSCPPADAVLAELAKRADVLPLGFHISYWDNLMRRPFSREA